MKRYSIKVVQLVLFLVVFASGVAVGMEEAMKGEALLKRLSDQNKRYQQILDLQDRYNIIQIDFKFIQDSKKWVCTFLEEGYQHRNCRLINPDVLAEVKNQLESLNAFEYLNMKKLEDIEKEINELRDYFKEVAAFLNCEYVVK